MKLAQIIIIFGVIGKPQSLLSAWILGDCLPKQPAQNSRPQKDLIMRLIDTLILLRAAHSKSRRTK